MSGNGAPLRYVVDRGYVNPERPARDSDALECGHFVAASGWKGQGRGMSERRRCHECREALDRGVDPMDGRGSPSIGDLVDRACVQEALASWQRYVTPPVRVRLDRVRLLERAVKIQAACHGILRDL